MQNTHREWHKEKPNIREDHKNNIKIIYECMKKILELDTENVVSNLNIMESVNNVLILNFRDLELYCSEMKENSETIKTIENEILKTVPKLEEIESRIDQLLAVSQEMDEWSAELEVKTYNCRNSYS